MLKKVLIPGVRLVAASLLAAIAFFVWPVLTPGGPRSQAARAEAWVASRGSNLPHDLRSIRAYPVAYQRVIYLAMSAEAKHRVWREYLQETTKDDRTLTEAQRQALTQFAGQLSVSDFDPAVPQSAQLTAALGNATGVLSDRADIIKAGAWTRDPGAANRARIGALQEIDGLKVRLIERLLTPGKLDSLTTAFAQTLQDCECWVQENGLYNCPFREGFTKYCIPNTPSPPYLCQIKNDAYVGPCSFTETRPCNGMCVYDHNTPGCGGCDDNSSCCSACQGTWDPNLNNCNTGSPLLINLHSNGNDHLTSVQDGVFFDISARGVADRVSWTSAGSQVGFLVLDRNGNGIIDDGTELFGTETPMRDGSRARNGFVALYDVDGGFGVSDLQIDPSDTAYSQIRVWLDDNHNGYSEPTELLTLADAGIVTLFADHRETPRVDQHGNAYKFEGTSIILKNGKEHRRRMFDVFFVVEQQ